MSDGASEDGQNVQENQTTETIQALAPKQNELNQMQKVPTVSERQEQICFSPDKRRDDSMVHTGLVGSEPPNLGQNRC